MFIPPEGLDLHQLSQTANSLYFLSCEFECDFESRTFAFNEVFFTFLLVVCLMIAEQLGRWAAGQVGRWAGEPFKH